MAELLLYGINRIDILEEHFLAKVLVIITMFVILFALGSGLYYLVKDTGNSKRTVKALSWRIGLSIALFLFLFIAYSMGWIQPHGIT